MDGISSYSPTISNDSPPTLIHSTSQPILINKQTVPKLFKDTLQPTFHVDNTSSPVRITFDISQSQGFSVTFSPNSTGNPIINTTKSEKGSKPSHSPRLHRKSTLYKENSPVISLTKRHDFTKIFQTKYVLPDL